MHPMLAIMPSFGPRSDHAQATEDLQAAIDSATAGSAAIGAFEEALASASQFPGETPQDHTVSKALLRARVILARLCVAEGREEAAPIRRQFASTVVRRTLCRPTDASIFHQPPGCDKMYI